MPKGRGIRRHDKPLMSRIVDEPKAPYSPSQPRDSKGRFVSYKKEFMLMFFYYLLFLGMIAGLVYLYK